MATLTTEDRIARQLGSAISNAVYDLSNAVSKAKTQKKQWQNATVASQVSKYIEQAERMLKLWK